MLTNEFGASWCRSSASHPPTTTHIGTWFMHLRKLEIYVTWKRNIGCSSQLRRLCIAYTMRLIRVRVSCESSSSYRLYECREVSVERGVQIKWTVLLCSGQIVADIAVIVIFVASWIGTDETAAANKHAQAHCIRVATWTLFSCLYVRLTCMNELSDRLKCLWQ